MVGVKKVAHNLLSHGFFVLLTRGVLRWPPVAPRFFSYRLIPFFVLDIVGILLLFKLDNGVCRHFYKRPFLCPLPVFAFMESYHLFYARFRNPYKTFLLIPIPRAFA